MKRKKRKQWRQKPINMKARQRSLAQNMTAHEIVFLRRLARANLVPFDFQVIIGYYIADFVIPSKMLIIELDGKHHATSKAQEWDGTRDKFLTELGFTVVRIPNSDIHIWEFAQIAALPHRPSNVYDDAIRWAGEHRTLAFKGVTRPEHVKQPRKKKIAEPVQTVPPKPIAKIARRLVPRLSEGVVPDWAHERMKESK